ncbi:MAG: hypothetical protein WED05_06460 [Candidatus Atabeyarchaeum deiterrae]
MARDLQDGDPRKKAAPRKTPLLFQPVLVFGMRFAFTLRPSGWVVGARVVDPAFPIRELVPQNSKCLVDIVTAKDTCRLAAGKKGMGS